MLGTKFSDKTSLVVWMHSLVASAPKGLWALPSAPHGTLLLPSATLSELGTSSEGRKSFLISFRSLVMLSQVVLSGREHHKNCALSGLVVKHKNRRVRGFYIQGGPEDTGSLLPPRGDRQCL